jgi:hypothetical protein
VELPTATMPKRSNQRDVQERVRSQRTSSSVPRSLFTFYMRSATWAHNHGLVGAPNPAVRKIRGRTRSRTVGAPIGVTNPT